MGSDRPGPGEELNLGERTEPRPAGTVIVLRGGSSSLEVLLVQRNPNARFMGGAWVFPGGAVDRNEGHGDGALRAAAIRELEEEAGISVGDPASLVAFSRWITPARGQDPLRHVVLPGAAARRGGGAGRRQRGRRCPLVLARGRAPGAHAR